MTNEIIKNENITGRVVDNRNSTKGLKADNFSNADMFKNWKSACENLRLAISAYAVADRSGVSDADRESFVAPCFDAYRKVLKFFEDKSAEFKLKPQAQDIHALRDIAGKYAKNKDSVTGKDFLPVGAIAFRKGVEDFVADRILDRLAKTASAIEDEKKGRRNVKKEAKDTTPKAVPDTENAIAEIVA